jgi:hypothetical protein
MGDRFPLDETSKRQNVKTSKRQNVKTSKRQNVKTSKRQNFAKIFKRVRFETVGKRPRMLVS